MSLNPAVADAGPLIHLHEIGSLPLLSMFECVHLPQAVWDETVGAGRVDEPGLTASCAIERHQLARSTIDEFVNAQRVQHLQAGEIECLVLCQRLSVLTLLTDDLAARDAAKRLGVQPVGSLGIILRAYRNGELDAGETERRIEQLHAASTLFIAKALIEMALAEVRRAE